MLHRAGWRGSAGLLNSMPNGNEILTPDGEGGYRGPYEGEVWYAKPALFSPSKPKALENEETRVLSIVVSRSTHRRYCALPDLVSKPR